MEKKKKYRPEDRWKAYKLTETEYYDLKKSHGGKCGICRKKAVLVIDHCHSSGDVRGLLCRTCNFGLGHFMDDTDFLNRAITYLNSND